MNIILEGCDKTGKTFLAKFLALNFNFKIVKTGQPIGDPYHEYAAKLLAANVPTVFDRLFHGELVYGPIFRGKSKLKPGMVRNLEMLSLAKNTLVIHCVDSKRRLEQRFLDCDELFATADKIPIILESYEKTLSRTILPRLEHQLNSKNDLTNKAFPLLKRLIEHHQAFKKQVPLIIGNQQNPIVLLVGDKRNSNQPHKDVALPFDFGKASEFLYKALTSISLNKIAIANSDNFRLKEFIKSRDCAVIALGKVASDKLSSLGIVHDKLNHPSYEARFHQHSSTFSHKLTKLIIGYDSRR